MTNYTEPKGIFVHDGICTTCLNAVEVEVRTITEVDECGSCRYSMRPFAIGSAHASGPCSCKYRIFVSRMWTMFSSRSLMVTVFGIRRASVKRT